MDTLSLNRNTSRFALSAFSASAVAYVPGVESVVASVVVPVIAPPPQLSCAVGGVTVTRATLHNYEDLRRKDVREGDIVILAGKGHETYQILKDQTIAFDDRARFVSLGKKVDPHLLELGNVRPRISSGDTNRASRLVSDHKAQSSTVIAPYCTLVVVVETFFNCIDFNRRKIMLGFYKGGHPERSIR